MGLSETILAAMIGAMATVSAALFQIITSIKSRNKVDVKPKRGSTMRSMLAVLALMVASAVGGFLYSELLKQRDGEDLRAMRMELRELKELTTAARTPAQSQTQPPVAEAIPEPQVSAAMNVNLAQGVQRAESVAYVPACRRPAIDGQIANGCSEAEAQRIALCGSIPAYARIEAIDLFAQPDAVQKPWEEHRALLEQDLGGARFTGKSFEYAQSSDLKAVCVNFMQWSSEHSHIARIVVNYAFGDAATPATSTEQQQPMGAVPAVIAAETSPTLSQQATFVTNTRP
jgi:hypothetical protein